jgi:transposase
VLEEMNETLVSEAMTEGVISGENVVIDATHIEARDQAPSRKKKEKQPPKKRGPKPKSERAQWEKEKQEKEEALPLYEKKI